MSFQDTLHKIVDLLPWRQESDKIDAHESLDEGLAELFGRNTTPAGVVKTEETETSVPPTAETHNGPFKAPEA